MKKTLLSIMVLIAIFCFCACGQNEAALEPDLNDPNDGQEASQEDIDPVDPSEYVILTCFDGMYHRTYFYDPNGNITEIAHIYRDDDSVSIREIFTYDSANNCIDFKNVDADDGSIRYHTTYEYDENNKLIREFEFDINPADEVLRWYEYEYNEDGILTKAFKHTELGANDKICGRMEYFYDENGFLIRIDHYDYEWLMATSVFTNDENGNPLTEEYITTSSGKAFATDTYTYNEYGQLIEHISTYGEKPYVDTYTYEYGPMPQ